jgi:hypothetical protein
MVKIYDNEKLCYLPDAMGGGNVCYEPNSSIESNYLAICQ